MRMRLAILAVLVAALPHTAGAQGSAPSNAPSTSTRYLVVPFSNDQREPRFYWLSEGSSVLMTDDLAALGAQVISREDRLRALERMSVPGTAMLSHATVIRLGQLLGATHVVVGGFRLQNGTLTVRARAIRLDSGRMLPEIAEEGPLDRAFDVHLRVARGLALDGGAPGSVGQSVGQTAAAAQGYPPLAAIEQYIKGLIAGAPAARLSFLDQALRLWPQFQRARLAQWDVHAELGDHTQALAVIRQVPASHALARRASFRTAVSLLHLGQLGEAYRTLDALNQSKTDPAVLNAMGIVELRRPAGTPAGQPAYFFHQASKLDPDDPDVLFNLGYAYWWARDTQAAIHWLREAVRRNPSDAEAHFVLGTALQTAGATAEAAREKELARQLSAAYDELQAKSTASAPVPRGLERLTSEIDVPDSLRIRVGLVASEQRDQRETAAFHLEQGRRLFQQERDADAVTELRKAVYLAPYQSEAHLLLGRIYLRTGRTEDAVAAFKISLWSEDTSAARLALADALAKLEKDK